MRALSCPARPGGSNVSCPLTPRGGGGESQAGACVVSPGCRLGIVGAPLLGCLHGNALFRAEYRGRQTSAVNRWLIIAGGWGVETPNSI